VLGSLTVLEWIIVGSLIVVWARAETEARQLAGADRRQRPFATTPGGPH
jgi:hypothetical protein